MPRFIFQHKTPDSRPEGRKDEIDQKIDYNELSKATQERVDYIQNTENLSESEKKMILEIRREYFSTRTRLEELSKLCGGEGFEENQNDTGELNQNKPQNNETNQNEVNNEPKQENKITEKNEIQAPSENLDTIKQEMRELSEKLKNIETQMWEDFGIYIATKEGFKFKWNDESEVSITNDQLDTYETNLSSVLANQAEARSMMPEPEESWHEYKENLGIYISDKSQVVGNYDDGIFVEMDYRSQPDEMNQLIQDFDKEANRTAQMYEKQEKTWEKYNENENTNLYAGEIAFRNDFCFENNTIDAKTLEQHNQYMKSVAIDFRKSSGEIYTSDKTTQIIEDSGWYEPEISLVQHIDYNSSKKEIQEQVETYTAQVEQIEAEEAKIKETIEANRTEIGVDKIIILYTPEWSVANQTITNESIKAEMEKTNTIVSEIKTNPEYSELLSDGTLVIENSASPSEKTIQNKVGNQDKIIINIDINKDPQEQKNQIEKEIRTALLVKELQAVKENTYYDINEQKNQIEYQIAEEINPEWIDQSTFLPGINPTIARVALAQHMSVNNIPVSETNVRQEQIRYLEQHEKYKDHTMYADRNVVMFQYSDENTDLKDKITQQEPKSQEMIIALPKNTDGKEIKKANVEAKKQLEESIINSQYPTTFTCELGKYNPESQAFEMGLIEISSEEMTQWLIERYSKINMNPDETQKDIFMTESTNANTHFWRDVLKNMPPEHQSKLPLIINVEYMGSYTHKKETISDHYTNTYGPKDVFIPND